MLPHLQLPQAQVIPELLGQMQDTVNTDRIGTSLAECPGAVLQDATSLPCIVACSCVAQVPLVSETTGPSVWARVFNLCLGVYSRYFTLPSMDSRGKSFPAVPQS